MWEKSCETHIRSQNGIEQRNDEQQNAQTEHYWAGYLKIVNFKIVYSFQCEFANNVFSFKVSKIKNHLPELVEVEFVVQEASAKTESDREPRNPYNTESGPFSFQKKNAYHKSSSDYEESAECTTTDYC